MLVSWQRAKGRGRAARHPGSTSLLHGPHGTPGASHCCTFCWSSKSQEARDQEVREDSPMGRDTEHVDMAAISPILTFPPAWRLRPSSSPSVSRLALSSLNVLVTVGSTLFPSFQCVFGRHSWCRGAEEGTQKCPSGLCDARVRGGHCVCWGLLSTCETPATLPLPETSPLSALGFCGSGTRMGLWYSDTQ